MNLPKLFILIFGCSLLTNCSSLKPILMSESSWKISDSYGHAVNNDSTYRITFGNDLIPEDLWIISNVDTLASHPNMYKYVQELLHLSRLDDSKLLFFCTSNG